MNHKLFDVNFIGFNFLALGVKDRPKDDGFERF